MANSCTSTFPSPALRYWGGDPFAERRVTAFFIVSIFFPCCFRWLARSRAVRFVGLLGMANKKHTELQTTSPPCRKVESSVKGRPKTSRQHREVSPWPVRTIRSRQTTHKSHRSRASTGGTGQWSSDRMARNYMALYRKSEMHGSDLSLEWLVTARSLSRSSRANRYPRLRFLKPSVASGRAKRLHRRPAARFVGRWAERFVTTIKR